MTLKQKMHTVEDYDNTEFIRKGKGWVISTLDIDGYAKDNAALEEWLDCQIIETAKTMKVGEFYDYIYGMLLVSIYDSITGKPIGSTDSSEDLMYIAGRPIVDV